MRNAALRMNGPVPWWLKRCIGYKANAGLVRTSWTQRLDRRRAVCNVGCDGVIQNPCVRGQSLRSRKWSVSRSHSAGSAQSQRYIEFMFSAIWNCREDVGHDGIRILLPRWAKASKLRRTERRAASSDSDKCKYPACRWLAAHRWEGRFVGADVA